MIASGVLVCGCVPTPSRELAAPHIVSPAPAAAKADAREAPRPSVRAAVSSPPRAAWPCALVAEDAPRDAWERAVFRYGERTSCRIPRALIVAGVYGCPDSVERTDAEGHYRTSWFEYDDEGRMIAVDGAVPQQFTWHDDRLVSIARVHGTVDIASYLDDGPDIIEVDAEGSMRGMLTLDGDRPVGWAEHEHGRPTRTAVIEWSNERPNKLRGTVTRTFLYECSAELLRDSAGGAPPVDEAIAAVPTDVRLASWTAVLAHHRRDCSAFGGRRCELVADFDGDGKKDRAVKIRQHRTRHAGIAIRWGRGGVSMLGAGVATRQLSTDVHLEGIDLSWEAVEPSFDYIERWSVVARSPTGFFGAGPKLGGGPETIAPEATGAGILIDTGDAALVIYWDGIRWRDLDLGF